MEIKEDHLLLPDTCQVYDHYCLLDDRSYIWGAPEPTKYQKILTLDGYIMRQEEQEVLISHSQKVRLVIGEAIKDLGRTYLSTKYAHIYITRGEAEYLDNFKAERLQLGAWVSARDDYLAFALEEQIMNAIKAVDINNCRQTRQLARTQLALASHSDDGMTYIALEENQFGLLWGESLYTFKCSEVIVTPRTGETCTKELPVHHENIKMYLQPLTRTLTQHATIVPCSKMMSGKFKTMKGQYIAANPQLHIVPTPARLEQHQGNVRINHTDMSTGGIYTEDQVTEFTKLLTYPKVRRALKNGIIHEVCVNNEHHLCGQLKETMGSEVRTLVPILNIRQRLLTFLHTFGEAAAACIAVYVICQLLYGIIGCGINIFNLRGVPSLRLLGHLLCPTWVVNYDYGQLTRATRGSSAQRDEATNKDRIDDNGAGENEDGNRLAPSMTVLLSQEEAASSRVGATRRGEGD